jgi:hypothetical protein
MSQELNVFQNAIQGKIGSVELSHLAYKSENVGKRNTRISYLNNESDSLFKDVRSPDNLDEEEYADLIQQIDKKSNDISVEMVGANKRKQEQ